MTTGQLKSAALEELERLQVSPAFRQSRQAARLLRYVVENSLEGSEESLRERAIGVKVFGRDAGYDTNDDSIVRVGVADLRKRLARAYHENGVKPALFFHIPVGSYRVEFQVAEVPVEAAAATPVRRRWVAPLAAGLAIAGVALALFLMWPAGVLDRFWAPALSDASPVVLLAPHPIVYTFARDTFRRFESHPQTHAQRQIEMLSGPPEGNDHLEGGGADPGPVHRAGLGARDRAAVGVFRGEEEGEQHPVWRRFFVPRHTGHAIGADRVHQPLAGCS